MIGLFLLRKIHGPKTLPLNNGPGYNLVKHISLCVRNGPFITSIKLRKNNVFTQATSSKFDWRGGEGNKRFERNKTTPVSKKNKYISDHNCLFFSILKSSHAYEKTMTFSQKS